MDTPLSIREVASYCEATYPQEAADSVITGVAALDKATEKELSFLAPPPFGGGSRDYTELLKRSSAGAILVTPPMVPNTSCDHPPLLVVTDPSRAFQKIVNHFYPAIPSGFAGIHPSAVIHPSATLGDQVTLGPYVVIDRGAVIGDGTTIGAHCTLGAHTKLGEDSSLYPHVTIREGCQLGDRVVIQPGVVIGGCGFGFASDEQGHHKLDQRGNVVIESDVEIGANTMVDRARFGSTKIGRGTKIDDAVLIAHGVEIGSHCLIAGQTAIAGSTKIGDRCVLAGQVGVAGHIEITDDVIIAARSGVISSIKEAGKYGGEPARPFSEFRRFWMRLLSLEKFFARQKELEKKFQKLENSFQPPSSS